MIIGAGDGPLRRPRCSAPAGTRATPDWGAYTVDEIALRRTASGVEEETSDADESPTPGSRSPSRRRYREGWLPDG